MSKPQKNKPPVVSAGPDQTVILGNPATLSGSVSDDKLPKPPRLTSGWTFVSGPGAVTFTNPNSAMTQASFTMAGQYVLRLRGFDGEMATVDDVMVTVNKPPVEPPPDPAGPLPELPRVQVDITYTNPTGQTLRVRDSGQLQTALNTCLPGDLIVVEIGGYVGSFSLPKKTADAPVYIVSSALAMLPSGRVSPMDAGAMPRLIAPDPTSSALYTLPSAHDYRFVGIDFGCEKGEPNNGLVRLGTGSETNVSDFPSRIVLDRCLIRGDAGTGGRRGVLLSGNHLGIVKSHISDWKLTDRDAQAIAGWTGRGPWRIEDCYLEASGEAFLSGGSDPLIDDLVPSDIQVSDCLFSKPLAWNPYSPAYDGSQWQCKNALELKNARRVLISGNTMENNWFAAQSGAMVLFTPKNQDGLATWSTVEDVTMTGNRIAGTLRGWAISGNDGGFPSAGGRRILIKNNYVSDLGGALWGEGQAPSWEASCVFLMTGGMEDVQIDHLTAIRAIGASFPGAFMLADGAAYHRFKLMNSIWESNAYGIKGGGTQQGNATLAVWFPNAEVKRNLMIGASSWDYPTDNFFPASTSSVGFVKYPEDVRLAAGGLYVGQGTDGSNPGAADSLLGGGA